MELENQFRKFARLPEDIHFMIFSTGSELCIRAQSSPKSKPIVVAASPDRRDMNQFWQLKLCNAKNSKYSIISVSLQLAMEVGQHGEVLLRPPNGSTAQQFFMAKPQQSDNSGFIIRSTYEQEKALCLYGALMFRQVDADALNFVFRFEPHQENHIAKNSTVFVNVQSNKVMEVSGQKKGEAVTAKSFRGVLAQRWYPKHIRNGWFQIENLASKYNLDSKHHNKGLLCQWVPNTTSAQLWCFERVGEVPNQYRVRSCQHKDKVIGEVAEQIVLVGESDASSTWMLDGFQPTDAFSTAEIPHPNELATNAFANMLLGAPTQHVQSIIEHQVVQSPMLPIFQSNLVPPIGTSVRQTTVHREVHAPTVQVPTMPIYVPPPPIVHNPSQVQTHGFVSTPDSPYLELIHSRAATYHQSHVRQEPPHSLHTSTYDKGIQVLKIPSQISHIRLNQAAQRLPTSQVGMSNVFDPTEIPAPTTQIFVRPP